LCAPFYAVFGKLQAQSPMRFVHDKAPPVVAVRVCNPDCSPFAING